MWQSPRAQDLELERLGHRGLVVHAGTLPPPPARARACARDRARAPARALPSACARAARLVHQTGRVRARAGTLHDGPRHDPAPLAPAQTMRDFGAVAPLEARCDPIWSHGHRVRLVAHEDGDLRRLAGSASGGSGPEQQGRNPVASASGSAMAQGRSPRRCSRLLSQAASRPRKDNNKRPCDNCKRPLAADQDRAA